MKTISLIKAKYPKMNKDLEVQLKDLHTKKQWTVSQTKDPVLHFNSKTQEVEIDFSAKEDRVKKTKNKIKIITKTLNK